MDDEICPICQDEESYKAHSCENCGRYVCPDCFIFEEDICIECG